MATQAPATEAPPAAAVGAGVPAGTVTVQTGPFTERLRISELRLTEQAITARLDVVSDVSEIINLEVRVDFYDSAGALLGSGRQVFVTKDTEAFHTTSGVVGLPLSVPAPASGAHSALLSVPVLVNE